MTKGTTTILWGPEWSCTICGRLSREYTDHTICYYCSTGTNPMSDVKTFEFYSDTNQSNAYAELSMMSLDKLGNEGHILTVSVTDMDAMGDSILAIIESNGGEAMG